MNGNATNRWGLFALSWAWLAAVPCLASVYDCAHYTAFAIETIEIEMQTRKMDLAYAKFLFESDRNTLAILDSVGWNGLPESVRRDLSGTNNLIPHSRHYVNRIRNLLRLQLLFSAFQLRFLEGLDEHLPEGVPWEEIPQERASQVSETVFYSSVLPGTLIAWGVVHTSPQSERLLEGNELPPYFHRGVSSNLDFLTFLARIGAGSPDYFVEYLRQLTDLKRYLAPRQRREERRMRNAS